MITDIFYLTDEKKDKYMLDFRELLELTNSDFWDIDDGLQEILIRINQNPNYQTLYSKKFKIESDSWNLGGESYLEITSSKDAWIHLSDILNQVKSCSQSFKSLVEIVECEPHENLNLNPKSSFNIGCIKDPNYFKINYFRISIESSDTKCHNKFWECIDKSFTI